MSGRSPARRPPRTPCAGTGRPRALPCPAALPRLASGRSAASLSARGTCRSLRTALLGLARLLRDRRGLLGDRRGLLLDRRGLGPISIAAGGNHEVGVLAL